MNGPRETNVGTLLPDGSMFMTAGAGLFAGWHDPATGQAPVLGCLSAYIPRCAAPAAAPPSLTPARSRSQAG